MEDVQEFIVNYVERRGKIPEDAAIDSFNFVKSGHIDSIGLFSFVIDIESRFDIEISTEDLMSPQLTTIGGLMSIISEKIGSKDKRDIKKS